MKVVRPLVSAQSKIRAIFGAKHKAAAKSAPQPLRPEQLRGVAGGEGEQLPVKSW